MRVKQAPEQPDNVDQVIQPVDIGTQLELGSSTKKVDIAEAPTKQVSQFPNSPFSKGDSGKL